MLPEGQEVLKITPLPESLIITHTKDHGLYTCPQDGCSFSTSCPSLLGLHKAQAHNIRTGPKTGEIRQYYCPHPGCYYTPESGRFFKTLDVLRGHYMKVHMEKKFKCNKCGKGFGLERDCLRHEKECGQSFVCPTCEKVYNNKGALRMHCVSKGHKKPPELLPKPKISVDKQQRPAAGKQHPVPIFPKFSPEDKISFIVPATTVSGTTTTSVLPSATDKVTNQVQAPIAIVLQNDKSISNSNESNIILPQIQDLSNTQKHPVPITIIHTAPKKKLLCDSVAQTVKSLSVKPKAKRHAPTQTRLSILERAMKSSNIPITKTSKSTQKSMTRKRKIKETNDASTGTKKYTPSSTVTVATLTERERMRFSQNIGSQTIFSILHPSQQKSTAVNTSDMSLETSTMSTQTTIQNPLLGLNQTESHSNVNYSDSACQSHQISYHPTNQQYSNSNTQTFSSSLLPQAPASQLNSSETQTQSCLTRSSSSTTQTPEFSALESSTQTLDLNLDNDSSLLDELFPDSSGISVDTQTFGCFSSDMMTQTLEQLASDESSDVGSNTLNKDSVFMTNDTMTQTFDQMVDNITQTLDEHVPQPTLCTDITTQTFGNIGTDIMTQTFDASATNLSIACGTQPSATLPPTQQQGCGNHHQSVTQGISLTSENMMSTITTQTDQTYSAEILSLLAENSISIQSTVSEGVQNLHTSSTSCKWNQTTNNFPVEQTETSTDYEVREMALQTDDIDLWELTAADEDATVSRISNSIHNESYVNELASNQPSVVNPVADSMTQTLSFPDDDMALDALLSDMATQTFDEDELTFDALLQSSDFTTDFATQTPQNQSLSNSSCQTPNPFCPAESETETNLDKKLSILWEREAQTDTFGEVKEMALQTESEDLWDVSREASDANISGGSNNIGRDIKHILMDETFEIGIQTTFDTDGFRVVGIQSLENELWEMGTQTGVDNAWEMGTQTGADNAWEMGTQTGADNAWEMGTQTGVDNAWEMGTQTGADNAWEMGTQTGAENAWEMGTQTGGDNAWEMGTQTGADNAWEMGTQTGAENAWEMGTQTGGDNAWEMGTQTMADFFTDTMTQTGDDLIDFLLTG